MAIWRGLPVFLDPGVALESTNPITGEVRAVMFWSLADRIVVHPERWDEFKAICETEPDSWREIQ